MCRTERMQDEQIKDAKKGVERKRAKAMHDEILPLKTTDLNTSKLHIIHTHVGF